MTAQIFDFQKIKADISLDSLRVEEDDFSVKVSSSDDPLFWIRLVERDDGEVIVTDFNRGNRSQFTLNAALRMAMARLFVRHPEQLRFTNISNAYQKDASDDMLETIRHACGNLAHKTNRIVQSVNVVKRDNKSDVIVALG